MEDRGKERGGQTKKGKGRQGEISLSRSFLKVGADDRGWSVFVQISHAEVGRLRRGSRLADVVRSDVSGVALRRPRAADEPDIR